MLQQSRGLFLRQELFARPENPAQIESAAAVTIRYGFDLDHPSTLLEIANLHI